MIRIVLAHPSRLICDSLRTALDNEPCAHIVGCAATAEELCFLIPLADIILLGTELQDVQALDFLDQLRSDYPDKKALILGLEHDPDKILPYIEAGAAGYILQSESIDDMVSKLQAASAAQAIISPEVAAAMMQRLTLLANLEAPFLAPETRRDQLAQLTRREKEILGLIGREYTNQEIADELFIECGTVKNHVHNILKKLEVSSRYEAASIYQLQNHQAPALAV